MSKLDWKALLDKVDRATDRWRAPTAVLYGNKVRCSHWHPVLMLHAASQIAVQGHLDTRVLLQSEHFGM